MRAGFLSQSLPTLPANAALEPPGVIAQQAVCRKDKHNKMLPTKIRPPLTDTDLFESEEVNMVLNIHRNHKAY